MVKTEFKFKFEIVSATLNGQLLHWMTLMYPQIMHTAVMLVLMQFRIWVK